MAVIATPWPHHWAVPSGALGRGMQAPQSYLVPRLGTSPILADRLPLDKMEEAAIRERAKLPKLTLLESVQQSARQMLEHIFPLVGREPPEIIAEEPGAVQNHAR